MKNIKEYDERYKVFCQLHNITYSKSGLLGYISDQKMLERFRKNNKSLDK